jgi:hypothetical protein
MANGNYDSNDGCVLIIVAIVAVQLNRIMAAQAAKQTICKYGYRG